MGRRYVPSPESGFGVTSGPATGWEYRNGQRGVFPVGTRGERSRGVPSGGCERSDPLDVHGQAHQVPLGLHFRETPEAEAAKTKHLLDPAVRRFGQPLPAGVAGPPASDASFFFIRSVAGRFAGSTAACFFPSRSSATYPSVSLLQLPKVRLAAIPRIRQHLRASLPRSPPLRPASEATAPHRSASLPRSPPPRSGARHPPPSARCSSAGSPPYSSS